MRSMYSSRKGLSPVLSTVLMILIVIIGMSMLFGFFVNYTRDFQTGSGSAVLESLVIEDAWFTNPGGPQITVYNVGKISLKIASIYVDGRLDSSPNIEIGIGQHQPLPVGSAHSGCTIKIVTVRGSAFEGSY